MHVQTLQINSLVPSSTHYFCLFFPISDVAIFFGSNRTLSALWKLFLTNTHIGVAHHYYQLPHITSITLAPSTRSIGTNNDYTPTTTTTTHCKPTTPVDVDIVVVLVVVIDVVPERRRGWR